MEKEYDLFNGAGWEKVSASQLPNVDLEGLKEVIKTGTYITCKYKNGREHLDGLVKMIENFEENNLLKKIQRCKSSKEILKLIGK